MEVIVTSLVTFGVGYLGYWGWAVMRYWRRNSVTDAALRYLGYPSYVSMRESVGYKFWMGLVALSVLVAFLMVRMPWELRIATSFLLVGYVLGHFHFLRRTRKDWERGNLHPE